MNPGVTKPSCLMLVTLTLSMFLSVGASFAHADLAIMQYHHISNETPASTSTTPSLFRGQLEAIEKLGLSVKPLERATESALAGELEKQAVAITFDDAFESVYRTAASQLLKRKMPFTIFVNTQAIDENRSDHMTWAQIQELADNPLVTVGNHSVDHGHLVQKSDESDEAWQKRIDVSIDNAHDQLSKKLGVDTVLFAYPYGEYDQKLESKLAERGWLGYGQHSGPVGKTSGRTRLPRFPMATTYGQLSSLPDKLTSQALPIDANALPDGVVTDNPPVLQMTLAESLKAKRLTCYGSGVGLLNTDESGDEGKVTITADEAFNSRRFRYNCTYPAGDGNFYWLSKQWLNLSHPED